jgi:glutathione synthase/RimK-type ligase-like ATP-grasp enzyme
MHVAFVTYQDFPELAPDDRLIADYLRKKNIIITPARWDDGAIDWLHFDAVIIRSPWDYYKRISEFYRWLEKLRAMNCPLLNPASVVEWNIDKRYFQDFAKKNILLPPFKLCNAGESYDLQSILAEHSWKMAVVKPAVSAGAFNTWVTTNESAAIDQEKFAALVKERDVIVQVFMEEILTAGELSLMFFNKKFSHAIRKNAKPGDFRIQTQYGGTVTPITPDPKILQRATDLVNSINEPLLYARVDGIVSNNLFYLMELELIEPVLYVNTDKAACENFYQALVAMVRP